MKYLTRRHFLAATATVTMCCLLHPTDAHAGATLKKGDTIAIVGDSITEQKMYCRLMEDYLVACMPQLDLTVVQLGWGGEQATGLLKRIDKDLFPFKPNLVTVCYGMNDGQYKPFEKAIGDTYAAALTDIAKRVLQHDASLVIGSPGIVDAQFARPNFTYEQYNDNLAQLSTLAKGVADQQHCTFADVHPVLVDILQKGIAKYGNGYHLTYDGVHPKLNGHLGMAYAFLKAMDMKGDLATITLDYTKGATATDGHQVTAYAAGKADLTSQRYPFCLRGDDRSPDSPRSALPLFPFDQELNRFMLVVTNLPSDKADVTWGSATKQFSKEQLGKGINLATEFPENPFSKPFDAVDAAVMTKQAFETSMIKDFDLGKIGQLLGPDAELDKSLDAIKAKFLAKHKTLQEAVRKALVPVSHSIIVTPR